MPQTTLQIKPHPYRDHVLKEVHSRLVRRIEAPYCQNRVAFEVGHGNEQQQHARKLFEDWCAERKLDTPGKESRQHQVEYNGRYITWELHTEFVSISWGSSNLEDLGKFHGVCCVEAYLEFPLVSAVAIGVVDNKKADKNMPTFDFHRGSLCGSKVENGAAVVMTDFRQNAEGFTVFEIGNISLPPMPLSILVRRVAEMESYRTFALLGLPLARELLRKTEDFETDHTSLLESIDLEANAANNRNALQKVQTLTLDLERVSQRAAFRFAASYAYADIMNQRFALIKEEQHQHFTKLEQFIRRRVDPAMATCEAVEKRQKTLSKKLGAAAELVNTRIGEDIQGQNAKVLQSLNETSKRQYRLQRTVEGLSVIAISYYAVGLLAYMIAPFAELTGYYKSTLLAVGAPVTVLIVWYFLTQLKSKH